MKPQLDNGKTPGADRVPETAPGLSIVDAALLPEQTRPIEKLKDELAKNEDLLKGAGTLAVLLAIPAVARWLPKLALFESSAAPVIAKSTATLSANVELTATTPLRTALMGQIPTVSVQADAAAEIPQLWQPKRSFADQAELMNEAGFPNMQRVGLAQRAAVNSLVEQLRAPMQNWTEDLRKVAKDRQGLLEIARALNGRSARLQLDPAYEPILNNRIVGLNSSLSKFQIRSGLPEMPITREDPGSFAAAFRRSDGNVLVGDEYLMSAFGDGSHRFVGTIAHENLHGEQMSLMIRRVAQTLDLPAGPELPQLRRLNDAIGGTLDIGYIAGILKANPSPLTTAEIERAEELWRTINIGTNGDAIAVERFSHVQAKLKGLCGTSNWVCKRPNDFAEEILNEATDPQFAELYFGQPTLPKVIERLQQTMTKAGQSGVPASAVEELKVALRARLDSLNAEVRVAYEEYMQLHEKEALYVGEMARLRSLELGSPMQEH